MPELRQDPIVGRWVVVAPERATRPHAFLQPSAVLEPEYDPFLEGNEEATPPEVMADRRRGTPADGPGWHVRVVPNKFPALAQTGNVEERDDGLYRRMDGVGVHEVIVECPQNETDLSRLPVRQINRVLSAYRRRLREIKENARIVHATIFKNKGAAAGATVAHSHSQLIALPVVAASVAEEIRSALDYYQRQGRCIYEEIIGRELQEGSRVVTETSDLVAFCPFAARSPYETWIVPRSQTSHYEEVSEEEIAALASTMKVVLVKLKQALDDPPYNYYVHTAPFHSGRLPHYRWHVEILPRLTETAGFEWGSGFHINPVPPEEAASRLRGVEVVDL